MFLLRELFKGFVWNRKIRIGFVLSVWPTPYYGKIMASTRLRAYDVINSFRHHPRYFVELYKPWQSYDIVIFQKKFDGSALRWAEKLKCRGTKIILDINVNYYDATSLSIVSTDGTRDHNAVMRFTQVADGVIASSDHIRHFVETLFPNKPVTYIPENITEDFFRVHKRVRETGPLALLYVGYAVKVKEILDIAPILRSLHQKYPFRIFIISEKNPHLQLGDIPVFYHLYQQKRVPKDMLSGDIFIAPRDLSQSYNLGHSFTKIGYPLSVGVPVVGSPVPSYIGSPALLCTTQAEWSNALERLLSSPEERRRLGMLGTAYCRDHFSTPVIREQYTTFFDSLHS